MSNAAKVSGQPPVKPLMISVSGIRGIVGQSLDPIAVSRYASAFGTWIGAKTVVVGRDSRVSGELFKHSVVSSLMACGCNVIDIGIVGTPTVEIAVKALKARGGIAITASHNPKEWNALKLIGPGGMFLSAAQSKEIARIVKTSGYRFVNWNKLGKLSAKSDLEQEHIKRVIKLKYLNIDKIRKWKFKVVVDCVNGAGGKIVPMMLREMGCEVVVLNGEQHGIFPRNPEPLPQNLKKLEASVVKHKADIGIAVDPDVDRVAFVSEKGHAIGEELSLALAVDLVLSRKRGPVVVNASTTRLIDDLATQYRVKIYRTKVGEINVSTKMKQVNAVIGGEGNGGVILPEVHLGRDAMTGIALVLQKLSSSEHKLSEIVSSFPQYHMIKAKVELGNVHVAKCLRKIEDDFSSEKIDHTDGLKISLKNGWIHIRMSNTEPIVRIICEDTSRSQALESVKVFTSYFG